MMRTYRCGGCKQEFHEFEEHIQRAINGVYHIRGECPYCRKFVKWVPYSESRVVSSLVKLFYLEDLDAMKHLHDVCIYDDTTEEIL